jgi:hypothetical protein
MSNNVNVDLEGNDIITLEEVLHTMDGESVDINICGSLGRLETIENFSCWRDGLEQQKLILSDENTEDYWFLDIKDIKEWSFNSIIDGVDIILNGGLEIELYKN